MPDKKSILVVNDHPETLRLISIILERNGLEVLNATSGAEAIRKTQTNYPDLIVMSQTVGIDACRALREDDDPRVADSIIVLFTYGWNPTDKEIVKAAGADGHIVHPSLPKSLTNMVNHFLANPHGCSDDATTGSNWVRFGGRAG